MQHLHGRIAKSDVRTTYVPRTYVLTHPALCLGTSVPRQKSPILDECRTLWGEPERVHAGTECAWSSCMCMSSECESDGELRTQTQITQEKVMTALIIDFRALEAVWQVGPGAVSVSHSPPRYKSPSLQGLVEVDCSDSHAHASAPCRPRNTCACNCSMHIRQL